MTLLEKAGAGFSIGGGAASIANFGVAQEAKFEKWLG